MIIHKHKCYTCGHEYNIYYDKVKGDIVVDDTFVDCSHCGTVPEMDELIKEIKYDL